jgi:hypothetical protein
MKSLAIIVPRLKHTICRWTLVLILIFAATSCATTYPERYSSDECLVIVSTELINPESLPVGRKYAFRLADGTIVSIGEKEFVAFKVYAPGMTIERISSRVESEYTGNRSQDNVDLPLPYIPGEVVVADYEFVHKLSRKDQSTILSDASFRKIEPGVAERLLVKLRAENGYAAWFAEPAALSRVGYVPGAARPPARQAVKPGYGTLKIEGEASGTIALNGETVGSLVPGTPFISGDLAAGDYEVAFTAADGSTDSTTMRIAAKRSATHVFIAGVSAAKKTSGLEGYSGQGYTLQLRNLDEDWLRSVRVFRDASMVYVVVDYLAARSSRCSFFNPPQGSNFMIIPESGLASGARTIVFAVSRAKLDGASDATLLPNFEEQTRRGMLYFRFPSGSTGLPEAPAPASIKSKAHR